MLNQHLMKLSSQTENRSSGGLSRAFCTQERSHWRFAISSRRERQGEYSLMHGEHCEHRIAQCQIVSLWSRKLSLYASGNGAEGGENSVSNFWEHFLLNKSALLKKLFHSTETCAWMFTAAFFTLAKISMQPTFPCICEWMNRAWCMETMECNSLLKKKMSYYPWKDTDGVWVPVVEGNELVWNVCYMKIYMFKESVITWAHMGE